MVQPVLPLTEIFQKIVDTEIEHELLMETYKESLKGQYESDSNIFDQNSQKHSKIKLRL